MEILCSRLKRDGKEGQSENHMTALVCVWETCLGKYRSLVRHY